MNKPATVEIPRDLIKKMDKAVKTLEDFTEEYDDYIFSKDKKFIDKMHKARKEHLSGNTKSFSEIRKKYV